MLSVNELAIEAFLKANSLVSADAKYLGLCMASDMIVLE